MLNWRGKLESNKQDFVSRWNEMKSMGYMVIKDTGPDLIVYFFIYYHPTIVNWQEKKTSK